MYFNWSYLKETASDPYYKTKWENLNEAKSETFTKTKFLNGKTILLFYGSGNLKVGGPQYQDFQVLEPKNFKTFLR